VTFQAALDKMGLDAVWSVLTNPSLRLLGRSGARSLRIIDIRGFMLP
jgi:hypothetical protein